jgi:hypothetical protein
MRERSRLSRTRLDLAEQASCRAAAAIGAVSVAEVDPAPCERRSLAERGGCVRIRSGWGRACPVDDGAPRRPAAGSSAHRQGHRLPARAPSRGRRPGGAPGIAPPRTVRTERCSSSAGTGGETPAKRRPHRADEPGGFIVAQLVPRRGACQVGTCRPAHAQSPVSARSPRLGDLRQPDVPSCAPEPARTDQPARYAARRRCAIQFGRAAARHNPETEVPSTARRAMVPGTWDRGPIKRPVLR